MNDQTQTVPAGEAPRPNLEGLPKEVVKYIKVLENRIEALKKELEANPAPEARGIAWSEMYFPFVDPETGEVGYAKDNITARSNVDAIEAHRQLRLVKAELVALGYSQKPPAFSVRRASDNSHSVRSPQPHAPAPADAGDSAPAPVSRRQAAGQQAQAQTERASTPEARGDYGGQWLTVKSIQCDLTKSGDPYLRCILDHPRFSKHGLPAYLDSCEMPGDVRALIESGQWRPKAVVTGGVLDSDYPDLKQALVSGDMKKIVGFRPLA